MAELEQLRANAAACMYVLCRACVRLTMAAAAAA
jgi:hypothetical protein